MDKPLTIEFREQMANGVKITGDLRPLFKQLADALQDNKALYTKIGQAIAGLRGHGDKYEAISILESAERRIKAEPERSDTNREEIPWNALLIEKAAKAGYEHSMKELAAIHPDNAKRFCWETDTEACRQSWRDKAAIMLADALRENERIRQSGKTIIHQISRVFTE